MTIHTIGEICNINALSIRKGEHPKQILYLDTANLVEGRICKLQEINFADAPSRAQRKINNDTILYSSVRPNLKHFGIMKSMPSNVIVSTGFITLDVKDKSLFSPEYIYYLLTQQGVVDYLQGIAQNGVSAYPSINPSDIANLKFNFPSLSDQEHIASVLTNIDRKIALNRQINDNLEAMAKQLYDYWFVQFDFPDENGKPYKSSGGKMVWNEKLKREIPEGWSDAKMSDFLTIKNGKDHKVLNDGIYPVYGSGGEIRRVSKYLYRGESVLIPRKGSLNNIMYVNEPFWTVDTMFYTEMKIQGCAKYVFYSIKDIDFTKWNTGTGVPSMTSSILYMHKMVMPNSKILQEFSSILESIFSHLKHLKDECIKLTKQRDELLPLLMNGQATVNYHLSDD